MLWSKSRPVQIGMPFRLRSPSLEPLKRKQSSGNRGYPSRYALEQEKRQLQDRNRTPKDPQPQPGAPSHPKSTQTKPPSSPRTPLGPQRTPKTHQTRPGAPKRPRKTNRNKGCSETKELASTTQGPQGDQKHGKGDPRGATNDPETERTSVGLGIWTLTKPAQAWPKRTICRLE